MSDNGAPLLEINELQKFFPIGAGSTVRAVDGVSFQLHEGEIFGLVGESGSGKSTIARTIMGLYPPTSGQILYHGQPAHLAKSWRQRNLQMIFQDSAAALNPYMRVCDIVAEPLRVFRLVKNGPLLERRVQELLAQVGLEAAFLDKRPGELSGGQRQRVAIARSIAVHPKLLVADEPVASLDLSIQAQIINLFGQLQREYGFAFLLIAHDLPVVRHLCDRVGVLLRGRMVELAQTQALFQSPQHPYTKALLSAAPIADPLRERQRVILEYNPEQLPENGRLIEQERGHWVYSG